LATPTALVEAAQLRLIWLVLVAVAMRFPGAVGGGGAGAGQTEGGTEGSRAEAGSAVLYALPPGRYLLVRSSIEPRWKDSVLLGNEYMPNPPPNIPFLLDQRPFYGMVLGPETASPPVTTHPLVGLIALNYNGSSSRQGALFFDCLARDGNVTRAKASGDLVLVIPKTGELVIDALAAYSTEERTTRDKNVWRDRGADQLAKALMR